MVMYWLLNKETLKASIIKSTVDVAKFTNINIDTLYLHFSRKKEKEYENNFFRIVKVEPVIPVRKKRKNLL